MNTENNLRFLPHTLQKERGWLDAVGATAAWLCALHCLALPFATAILPLLGLSFLLDETTEIILIGISILIAALSLLPAYFRQHRKLRALAFFAGGIGLIVLSHELFEDNLIINVLFLVVGAFLISAAHPINRRLCRSCAVCQANCSSA